MNKPLKDLNLEELLQELETGSSGKQFRTDGVEGDVLQFFNQFCIQPGSTPVASMVIFKIYQAWSKKPVSMHKFALRLREVLPTNKGKVYIDESAFKIRREDWVYFYSHKPKQKATEQVQKRHFDAFIKHFDLKPGVHPVNFETIVLLYSRFINEIKRKSRTLSRDKLISFMALYFAESITTRGSYFYVSDTIWNSLNKEVYNEKEKNSKKLKKIPITHPRDES